MQSSSMHMVFKFLPFLFLFRMLLDHILLNLIQNFVTFNVFFAGNIDAQKHKTSGEEEEEGGGNDDNDDDGDDVEEEENDDDDDDDEVEE